MDDFITSYLLKTCLMKLLPRHSKSWKCNCNEEFPQTEQTQECKWPTVERDSACGWAIRIYEKLETDLETKKIETWYGSGTIVDCTDCKVERGCCKKRKLTLAMTSQILDWLKQHEDELTRFDSGESRRLVYCRPQQELNNTEGLSGSELHDVTTSP